MFPQGCQCWQSRAICWNDQKISVATFFWQLTTVGNRLELNCIKTIHLQLVQNTMNLKEMICFYLKWAFRYPQTLWSSFWRILSASQRCEHHSARRCPPPPSAGRPLTGTQQSISSPKSKGLGDTQNLPWGFWLRRTRGSPCSASKEKKPQSKLRAEAN